MSISPKGLSLIKKFEGMRLIAYLCPAGVPTIGYGHTEGVKLGDKITEEQAESFLRYDLVSFEQCVSTWTSVKINQNEFDALVSFAFNVGCTAYKNSTLLKLLNQNTDRKVVAAEFSRWVKDGEGNTLQGLVNRREAEKKLFLENIKHPKLGMSILAKKDTWLKKRMADSTSLKPEEKLFVPKGSAWEWSEITMFAGCKHKQVILQADNSKWYIWDDHWKIINDTVEGSIGAPKSNEVNLKVPYFSQRDNYRDADRTCYSSSCAMLLSYLRSEAVSGDDEYIRTVFDIGDTTEAWVQIKALETYGVEAEFRQDGDWEMVEELLRSNVPVPLGILHRGSLDNPVGGHWIVCKGITADGKGLFINDPYGELDLIEGGYPITNGSNLVYSKKNLSKRWMPEGNGSGWFIKALKW